MLTINTLEEAKAAAWRGAVRGLAWQDWRRSATKDDGCLLTAPNGRHCAMGWLLIDPPELGSTSEPVYAGPLQEWLKGTTPGNRDAFQKFVTEELQSAHDCNVSREKMKAAFVQIGLDNGWKWPSGVPQ